MHRVLRPLALIAILALPVPVFAQNVPWIAAGAGYHTYGMSDVNDSITELNGLIAPFSMDEIHHGFGFGGMVGVDMPMVSLALSYDRLTGSSKVSDGSGSIEYNVPANLWMAQAVYRPASMASSMKLGIGVGGGLVSSSANVKTSAAGLGSETQKLEGHGGAFEVFASGEFELAHSVALVPNIGYRYAKIGELKSDGTVLQNGDGSKFTIDYSGLLTRLMLKFTL